MKLTHRSVVITAIAMATALGITGCSQNPASPPTTPGNQQPAPAAPPAEPDTEDPPCEASDIAEGDFAEDCFGITAPTSAKKITSPAPKPSASCKRNEKHVNGKCTKVTGARR